MRIETQPVAKDSTVPAPRRRRSGRLFRWTWRLLFGLAVLTGLAWLAALWHTRAGRNREIAALRARGEAIYLADLARPRPLPDQDPWIRLDEAVAQVVVLNAWNDRSDLFDYDHGRPPVAISPEPVLTAMAEANRGVRPAISAALALPPARVEIDYQSTNPYTITLNQEQSLRQLARALRAEVIAALAAGRGDEATGICRDSLRLPEIDRDGPFLVSQLIRFAMLGLALSSLEDVMAYHDLSDQQRTDFDQLLAQIEGDLRVREAMVCERAAAMTTLERCSSSELGRLLSGDSGWDALLTKAIYSPLRPLTRPLIYDDQRRLLVELTAAADVIDRPGADGFRALEEAEERFRTLPKHHAILRLFMPATTGARGAAMRIRQRMVNARWALRVDRYRRRQMGYPPQLEAVADAALERVEPGRLRGEPVVLHHDAGGFQIYAIGQIQVDDRLDTFEDHTELNVFRVLYPEWRRPAPPPEADGSAEEAEQESPDSQAPPSSAPTPPSGSPTLPSGTEASPKESAP